MSHFKGRMILYQIAHRLADHALHQAAIGAEHLAVDPSAIGTNKEGHDGGNIIWRSDALHRAHLGHALDQFWRFAGEEEVGRDRPRSDGIDRDGRPRNSFERIAVMVSTADLVAA